MPHWKLAFGSPVSLPVRARTANDATQEPEKRNGSGASEIKDLRNKNSSVCSAPELSRWHITAAVQVVDVAVMMLCAALSLLAQGSASGMQPIAAVTTSLIMAVVALCVLRVVGSYAFRVIRQARTSSTLAAVGWVLGAAPLVVSVTSLPPGDALRQWVLLWFGSTLGLIVAARISLARICGWLLRARRLAHTVCLIGAGQEAVRCMQRVMSTAPDTMVLGHFWTVPDGNLRLPWLGSTDAVATFLHTQRVDELIVATPRDNPLSLQNLVSTLQCLPVRVTVWPCSALLAVPSEDGGPDMLPPAMVSVAHAPLYGWRWVIKDIQDRLAAGVLLLLLAPLFAVIAVGIKVSSPGPVLFLQEREGYAARPFRIFKFRTMRPTPAAGLQLVLTTKNDSRIFPFGAWLRKTSLDELPQLLNVLTGDMWLIGPRPHSRLATASGRLYQDIVCRYAARHRVKPGMTGWAQINGWRGPTDTREQIEQRVVCDLFYIDNWSPMLDLKILLRTATHGFIHENAF